MFSAISATAAEIAVLRNGFEIRHATHVQNGENTRLYLEAAPEAGYVDIPTEEIVGFRHDDAPAVPLPAATASEPATSPDWRSMVSVASERHQVDADLISSVIHAESNFNPLARSPKGAQGLMQLMPGTASRLGVENPFQPAANIDAGTRYLRELLLLYNDDIVKALAAYNAGPDRVAQYHGIPPYPETRAYVARVVREFNSKKLASQKQMAQNHKTIKARSANTAKKAAVANSPARTGSPQAPAASPSGT